MNESSFYGGQPGTSFIIIKSYLSIAEMVDDFKRGPDFTAVHFEEHVLINTVNKNDPDNGKIFRRGLNYTNDLGGAVYVGTIVGPAGKAPMLEMTTIDVVKNMQEEEGYTYRYSEGEYAPLVNLIPGREEDGTFNDAIKWACCSVRNPNNEDTTAYIGFIFPYLVIDFTSYSVNPYYHRDNETDHFTNINLVDRIDDQTHPYHEKFNISVPKGIKGDTFKNFRIIPASEILEDYDGKEDDILNKREVLVYDYYHYDKDAGGEPVSIQLGDYNMIKEIIIDEDGTFTVDYTHDDSLVLPHKFKWIRSVELLDNGHFTVIYNYDKENDGTKTIYETDLDWVDNIRLSHDGVITLEFSTSKEQELSETLKWIDDIHLDENGILTIYYNNDTQELTQTIRWVNDISMDSKGTITLEYNDKTEVFEEAITWLEDIDLSDSGILTIHYNNKIKELEHILRWLRKISLEGDGSLLIEYNDSSEKYDKVITWIDNLEIIDDGSIIITYNNKTEKLPNIIKWIDYINIEEDGTFSIVYNNDTYIQQQLFTWIKNIELSEDGLITVNYNNHSEQLEHVLTWVKDFYISKDGTVKVTYNNREEIWENLFTWVEAVTLLNDGTLTIDYNNKSESFNNAIKWIQELHLGEDGSLVVNFNTGEIIELDQKIKWIQEFNFSDDGTLSITYNTDSTDVQAWENKVKWITDVYLKQDGEFHIGFNNGDKDYDTLLTWVSDLGIEEDGTIIVNYNNGNQAVTEKFIKKIDDIVVNTYDETGIEGNGNQKIHITYNTGEEEDIGCPINYILETVITEDYQYLVRYSDPARRLELKNSGKNYTYNGKDDWHNLGNIKEDSGILVGLNIYNSQLLNNILGSIEYLNNTFPQGLQGLDLKGKVVSIGMENDAKRFYAFDYTKDSNDNYVGWYYLGTIQLEVIPNLITSRDDEDLEEKKDLLPPGGVWFIVEN